MKLIVCLDNKNGMLFNGRRQSSDKIVTQKILELVGGNVFWMNAYSAALFRDFAGNISIDENFLELAKESDYCFVEDVDVTLYLSRIDSVTIFRWNRTYPADLRCPVDLPGKDWKLVDRVDFPGNSHEKITMEVYRP